MKKVIYTFCIIVVLILGVGIAQLLSEKASKGVDEGFNAFSELRDTASEVEDTTNEVGDTTDKQPIQSRKELFQSVKFLQSSADEINKEMLMVLNQETMINSVSGLCCTNGNGLSNSVKCRDDNL